MLIVYLCRYEPGTRTWEIRETQQREHRMDYFPNVRDILNGNDPWLAAAVGRLAFAVQLGEFLPDRVFIQGEPGGGTLLNLASPTVRDALARVDRFSRCARDMLDLWPAPNSEAEADRVGPTFGAVVHRSIRVASKILEMERSPASGPPLLVSFAMPSGHPLDGIRVNVRNTALRRRLTEVRLDKGNGLDEGDLDVIQSILDWSER